MSKQNVYDNAAFFDNFQSSRSNTVNFNDCIETPILFGMLPDLHGKKVLDIGCGMGQHELIFRRRCWSMPKSTIAVPTSSISGWPWKILTRSIKRLTL